jgi:uracil phosphoribosyltransferase
MVHELGRNRSVFNVLLSELRDVQIQKDRMRFRRNLERMGEIFAYEISKVLDYEPATITTPLGEAETEVIADQPILCTILRAGLPLHHGILNVFDRADSAYIAAYRKHHKGGDFEIEVDYVSSPQLDGKELILADTMLATGASLEKAYKQLLHRGTPKRVHVVSVIASAVGLNHIRSKMPENTEFWIGAVDHELTAQAYIVPGLGDAGDLAYGRKD